MRRFIKRKMDEIFNDFISEISLLGQFCDLKDISYETGNIPDYSNRLIQQLYLLRYLPAYLTEYYLIYRNVIDFNFINHYNVLSIGSGANLDFYGLYFALDDNGDNIDLAYTGLDLIDWSYKENLGVDDCVFLNQNINEWESLDEGRYNAIIFPKSIGEFDNQAFEHLLDVFLNTTFHQDRLIIISSMRQLSRETDAQRFGSIINLFTDHLNYRNLDDIQYYYGLNEIGGFGLRNYCPHFYYPDDVKNFISNLLSQCPTFQNEGESCEFNCSQALNRNPILTGRYLEYQINRLER